MASNKIYGLPNKRKVPTPKGRASDLNLAAKVHQTAAYRPKPFPKQS